MDTLECFERKDDLKKYGIRFFNPEIILDTFFDKELTSLKRILKVLL